MNEESPLKIKSFTDLRAWQQGHFLVIKVYETTKSFPKEERYSLTDQMQRAAISVTSNIAEGFGRRSSKERIQFFHLAQGSLTELKNQLLVARDVGYLPKDAFDRLAVQANVTHRLLQGLLSKTKELATGGKS